MEQSGADRLLRIDQRASRIIRTIGKALGYVLAFVAFEAVTIIPFPLLSAYGYGPGVIIGAFIGWTVFCFIVLASIIIAWGED